jgi:hypothetical protein
MTPEQRTNLEVLVSRPLTTEEVDQITVLIPDKRVNRIAEILSAGRSRFVTTYITEQDFINRASSGFNSAMGILDKLDTYAAGAGAAVSKCRLFLRLLRSNVGVDLGGTRINNLLGDLVSANVITSTDRQEIRVLASNPDAISPDSVSLALGF